MKSAATIGRSVSRPVSFSTIEASVTSSSLVLIGLSGPQTSGSQAAQALSTAAVICVLHRLEDVLARCRAGSSRAAPAASIPPAGTGTGSPLSFSARIDPLRDLIGALARRDVDEVLDRLFLGDDLEDVGHARARRDPVFARDAPSLRSSITQAPARKMQAVLDQLLRCEPAADGAEPVALLDEERRVARRPGHPNRTAARPR